jgi:hypothetical protein
MFKSIRPSHLLRWGSGERKRGVDSILSLIKWFNSFSLWIPSQIVRCERERERESLFLKGIELAEVCVVFEVRERGKQKGKKERGKVFIWD